MCHNRAVKRLPEELLDEVTQRLVDTFAPEAIYLFGSHAWGEPSEDSDLDLLVIVSDSELEPVERAQQAHHALGEIQVAKDVVVRTNAEVALARRVYASLIGQILDEGRLLWTKPSINLSQPGSAAPLKT